MDKIFNRKNAAKYLGMSERNLSRLMAVRLVPFIKCHFSKDPKNGRSYFSKQKLDIWMNEDRVDPRAMSESEKEVWKMEKNLNIAAESSKEAQEQKLAVEVYRLSKKLVDIIDSGEEFDRDSDDMLEDYGEKVPELHELEKRRLREFFEDEEALFKCFSVTFSGEIKEKKKKEVQPKEMRGGIPVERYEQQPGTKKEKKQNIQVEQLGSEIIKKVEK